MHGRPTTQSIGDTHASHPNRWRILGVLVLALLVTSIDHTIINVAMPSLVGDLGASSAQLQWIVASYTIVFAGLLLTAGSVGDRFGRRHALLAGLATFLAGSIVAATAGSTTALIAGRCVMGLGGALIMPTTLSILVNVFGDPRERAKAIAAWTAASGAGIALGPIVGGALMRNFSWSSVFWINVPLLVAAFIGALHLIPDSRDPHATRLDPVGAVLSIAAISTLVYAIIQAPERGWTSSASLVNFAVGTVIAILFVGWEMRRDEPMLDMSLFRNRSFSAGSLALALLFFAMAGTVFLQAQYLQFVLDYTPLAAGFALVPAAIGMLLGTGAGAHLAQMHGGRIAVTAGTLIATAGVAVQAAFVDGGSYLPTGVGLLLFGLGAGIAMPPATEMIMATLPPARAGVGSAVNDTVREFGGALGVAVIGSVAATSYATSMRGELDQFPNLTGTDRSMLVNNVGAAIQTSQHLGDQADQIAAAARTAFVDSMHSSLWIAAGLAFCAAVVAFTQLPRQTVHATHHAHGARVAHGGHHAVAHAGHHPHVAASSSPHRLKRRRHEQHLTRHGRRRVDHRWRCRRPHRSARPRESPASGHRHRRPDPPQRDRRRVPRLPHPRRDRTQPLPYGCTRRAALIRRGDRPRRSHQRDEHRRERVDDAHGRHHRSRRRSRAGHRRTRRAPTDRRSRREVGQVGVQLSVLRRMGASRPTSRRHRRSPRRRPPRDHWSVRGRRTSRSSTRPKSLALVGDGTTLSHVTLRDGRTIAAAAAFVKAPVVPRSSIARALGCEVDDDGYIVTNETGATSHPLVWAAGDVRRPPPMPHQVVLAAADGSTAAIAIHKAFVCAHDRNRPAEVGSSSCTA